MSERSVPDDLNINGAALLDEIADWYGRFILVTDPSDLKLLALWTVHTWVAPELYTTPRLLIDSTVFGSGKSTLLEHLQRLCFNAIMASSLLSEALMARVLQNGGATFLLDEVDKAMPPGTPGVDAIMAVVNNGYRRGGATRPVLEPDGNGGWNVVHMPQYAPVAMAGNSPRLMDDVRSRFFRILLMPDLNGEVEDSDWDDIQPEITELAGKIAAWADSIREKVAGLKVDLPAGCVNRHKDKWRPLMRVAVVAGGNWPEAVTELIIESLAEDAAEKEAGLKTIPPNIMLLTDLWKYWPENQFVSTQDLVALLVKNNPSYWGADSPYGKTLTETRFGRMVKQCADAISVRPERNQPRGFRKSQFELVWHRVGVAPLHKGGAVGSIGEPGAENETLLQLLQGAPGAPPTREGGINVEHVDDVVTHYTEDTDDFWADQGLPQYK